MYVASLISSAEGCNNETQLTKFGLLTPLESHVVENFISSRLTH